MEQSTQSAAVPSIERPRLAVFDPEASGKVRGDTQVTPAAAKRKRAAKSKADRDFPLWFHGASGRWCRTINKTRHYFGTDKAAALAKWLDEKDDLIAGRPPRRKTEGLTLGELCNEFLTHKQGLVESGELGSRTFGLYKSATDKLIKVLGLNRLVATINHDDFRKLRQVFAKTNGLVGIQNNIRLTRIVLRFASEELDQPVVKVPKSFSVKQDKIRKAASGKAPRMFEPAELAALLNASDATMRSWILLGLNAAYGQNDLASLPQAAIDLESGWATFPRVKNGIARKCWLWPETVAAVRDAMAERPPLPKDSADADCVFVTKFGNRLVRATKKFGHIDAVALEFGKLLVQLGLKRPGLQFYALRHTFRTIADECRDFPAIDRVMGHTDASMGARYRERIDDSRIKAVCERVRCWLFPVERQGQ